MNSGKRLSFYSLFNEVEFIEIPIIQRDYAQGRVEEVEVRSLFLSSLFNALTQEENPERQPLDLDFVYGSYEGNDDKIFSVLDGQQRLTTLFLLHWYLAVENECLDSFRKQFVTSKSQSRFTYKTRPSTTDFFNALTATDFALDNRKISTQISDCNWFYLSWKYDPTVHACLCMLDAIQEMFSGKAAGLFKKLSNIDNPYITFQFLDLHSFGLSDELYIKMNARGKPLTVFENFKAKLEQFIESYTAEWPPYKLSFRDGVVRGYEYFIHKIDTDWADLFWPYRKVCSDDNTFDDELMNFFRLIIAYQYLLDNKDSPAALAKTRTDIFGTAGKLHELTLSEYEALGCFNQGLIVRLIDTLDLIAGERVFGNKVTPYLKDQYYYQEENTFKRVIANSANYDDKLRFFAFYAFLSRKNDLNELQSWMRVVYNLVSNTITDSPSDFYRALFEIDSISQLEASVLEYLANDCDISVFSAAQVLEEKIKAHLILKSADWKKLIIGAEKHTFFDGQIGCLLSFSGILAFYREHRHCDWDVDFNKGCFEQFERYFKALEVVFDTIRESSASIGYAWERAVLSKGNYCTTASGDRMNLLSSRDRRNNIPRDHSWRRVLRIGDSVMENRQTFVKDVIDDPLFNVENLEGSLEDICNSALQNSHLDEWRYFLIKHNNLIRYCEQGFISHSNEEAILLSQSQRNHYHSELFTKALELELKENVELIAPFTQVSYEAVKSREDDAFAQLRGFLLDGKYYFILICKPVKNFIILFQGTDHADYSDKLKSVLEEHGFNWIERFGSKGYFHQTRQANIQQTKSNIFDLCSGLKELINK